MKKVIIVGGVSGVGKTTIGKLLAKKTGLPFYDGDDYHPQANIKKMEAGQPLNDLDRDPWLKDLAGHIADWQQEEGAVLACSALKECYRETLRQKTKEAIIWVFLEGTKKLLTKRIGGRKDHFFNADLLQSQLDTYTRPRYGIFIDVDQTPGEIVQKIVDEVATTKG